jgi:hypothetical protein
LTKLKEYDFETPNSDQGEIIVWRCPWMRVWYIEPSKLYFNLINFPVVLGFIYIRLSFKDIFKQWFLLDRCWEFQNHIPSTLSSLSKQSKNVGSISVCIYIISLTLYERLMRLRSLITKEKFRSNMRFAMIKINIL